MYDHDIVFNANLAVFCTGSKGKSAQINVNREWYSCILSRSV